MAYSSMPFRKKRKRQPSKTLKSASSDIESRSGINKLENGGKVMSVTRGQGNVFEDLGFDAEEAANLKIRADLMLDLRQYI